MSWRLQNILGLENTIPGFLKTVLLKKYQSLLLIGHLMALFNGKSHIKKKFLNAPASSWHKVLSSKMPEVKLSSLGWKIRHLKVSFIVSAADCKTSCFPNLPYFAMPLVYLIQPLATFLEQKKSYNPQFYFMLTWQHKQQRALLFAWILHKTTASKRSKTSNFRPTYIPGIQSGYPAKCMPAHSPVSLQQVDTQLDSSPPK